ncbi:PAS domain-containing sensor histidine kinase [Arthrobacter sp. YN]|uniref:PAS domain-containing sensor histidine kinase n=1 Tax=Arthrobacter sp. YN TaxID=2020486 RepID=UPI000B60C002|nr:HAMP domain-containing sensor histidine kinase [Arthrobacter sp. YN]ASN20207.1 two-component sensor histidine kinase [Arthrobacter sp. YN]
MESNSVFLPLAAYFNRVGLRKAVILCQLPLTIIVILIAGLAAVFSPPLLQSPAFIAILLLHALILLFCMITPWKSLPWGTFVLVPVMDCLAVALTREVGGPVLSVVGLLMAFPVIWLATSASKTRAGLAVLASFVGTVGAPFVLGHQIEGADMIRMTVHPFIMTGLAVTSHVVAKGLIRSRNVQDEANRELARMHKETQDHEKLLQTVLETVDVGVWAVDTKGADILTNRRLLADRSSFRDASDGQNPFTLGPETAKNGQSPAEVASGGGIFTNKLIRLSRNGEESVLSVAARPLHDDQDHLKGSVLVFTDVTPLVNARKHQDRFVATISHELRTPLTSILGYLELLGDEPGVPYFSVIERNAQRLLSLVNDLLMAASDDVELRRSPINVSELVQATALNAQPAAAAKGINIDIHTDPDVMAYLDPAQFSKALNQILSNAVKFSPDHTCVSIGLAQNAGDLTLSVRDQGIGMTEQEQHMAFAKFFRADHVMETAIQGAGLGLPITKAIIEAHGGTIKLSSQPDKGTTVILTVPCQGNRRN